ARLPPGWTLFPYTTLFRSLADDCDEVLGGSHAHHLLLMWREDGDHARDRLDRVRRMQRREHEVPGLGCLHRGVDGRRVTHLADQDDVGVLAPCRAQTCLERLRVLPDVALR